MSRRDVAIEIIVPTEGIHTELPRSMITPRSTPEASNCGTYYGVVQKEYGTSLFCTGTIPAPINHFFEAPYATNTVLLGYTHTGVYKFGSGTWANDGQVYSGTFINPWSVCMHNDVVVFGQGNDPLQYKLSPTATATNMAGAIATTIKAKAVVSFKEHLCVYNVTENGAASPKRAQWTKVGLLGYTASDWTTGTAQFLDVQDVEGDILTAAPIGQGAVIVYGDSSIHMQEWIGGTSVFVFTKMYGGLSLPSARGILANDDTHYVFTRDNIYEYKGGKNWKAIGDPIKADLYFKANPASLDRVFLNYIKEDDILEVHVPTGTSTSCDTVWTCKVRDNYSWFVKSRDETAAGKSTRPASLTIGELVGNIGAQNWKFGDLHAAQGATVYIYGTPTGHVTKLDKQVYSVSASGTSSAQVFKFSTKALTSINDIDPLVRDRYNLTKYMDNNSRWLTAYCEAKGAGSLYMNYSTDEGNIFEACPESPKTLNSTWSMYQFDIDRVGQSIMLQITNTAADEVVHMRYMKVTFVPGAEGLR